jgi:predicted negative regulator of RcsB-dependent stress response
MREDLEQQEQLDAIKGFWSDNKRWIVPMIALVVLTAVALNGWSWWQNRQAEGATEALMAMEGALGQQDVEKARVAYKVLVDDFSGSTQAAIGGLAMAKVFASSGDLTQARSALEAVSKHSEQGFAWIAKVRLAGVMLDEDNAKSAVSVLEGTPPKEFLPIVNDRRGDVHVALGNKEEARSAWKLAAEGFSAQSPSRELVLRKLQTMDSFTGAK